MSSTKPDNQCILCGSNRIRIEDSISSDQIVGGYATAFNVNVKPYFSPGNTINLIGCDNCGLLSYDPMPAGNAGFYEELQKLPWYYQDIKPEYDFAKTHVEKNDHVLEVGCGKGVFRSFLPESINYRGLEFNQTAIDKATAQGLRVTAEPIQQHADAHPGEYDVVCHFQVLEHVTDPQGFLHACAKAVKPGGKLIVAVPAEDSFLSICENGWLNMPPHHVSRWKDQTLRHALETEIGFSVQDIWHEPVAEYHKGWHRSVMINYALKHLLSQSVGLGNHNEGLLNTITNKLTRLKFFQEHLFDSGIHSFPHSSHGHTVCAVAFKP